jgi:hypothetical protein
VERYACILRFDTDDKAFARGFELGRLWGLLSSDPAAEAEELVHVASAEMCLRMGEALGRPVSAEEHDDNWMTVRFAPADKIAAREG